MAFRPPQQALHSCDRRYLLSRSLRRHALGLLALVIRFCCARVRLSVLSGGDVRLAIQSSRAEIRPQVNTDEVRKPGDGVFQFSQTIFRSAGPLERIRDEIARIARAFDR